MGKWFGKGVMYPSKDYAIGMNYFSPEQRSAYE